jgi:hypothetical protein
MDAVNLVLSGRPALPLLESVGELHHARNTLKKIGL